jgi:hypothetical protein
MHWWFRSKRPQLVIVAKLKEEQLRLPVITHASPQWMKTPNRDPRLRWRGEVAVRHHCRTTFLRSSSDFTLQNPSPRVDRALRSKSIHPVDFEATTKSKYDAFNKEATTMPLPSHIHNGPGFHPWTSTLGGYRTPPTGKAAPMASLSPRLSPKTPLAPMSSQEAGPLAVQHLQTPLSRRPMEASSEGNDAPAARGSRTAALTAMPSDQATHGAGPASTACVTPPHVEAVADHRRWHKHPLPRCPRAMKRGIVRRQTRRIQNGMDESEVGKKKKCCNLCGADDHTYKKCQLLLPRLGLPRI